MKQEEFDALKEAAAQPTPEQVEDYNETLRQWRAKCRKCGVPLVGTLAYIRGHKCDG
jgi:hypothetical protein